MHDKLKCYVLYGFADKNPNYKSWMADCPFPVEVVDELASDWQPPSDAGLIVTHMHYRWEEVSALARIYKSNRIPILILADGILEYRNTWQNPAVSDGAIFQPVVGHKLACIGRGQARIVEAWNNVGKCEVVGLPRLDQAELQECLPVQDSGIFRILVATASTPAFTDGQRAHVIHSLDCLKKRFDNNPYVNHRKFEVTWRVTSGLDEAIGLTGADGSSSVSLSDAIEMADAVITTPSTLYLESIQKRRPTAILDFNNSPLYVPSAWMITSPAHINPVLSELERPSPSKMQFQEIVLHDQLEIGNSKNRLFTLMEGMVEAGKIARENDQPISLKPRILSDSRFGFQKPSTDFDQQSLYRDNPVQKIDELELLRVELNHAVKRLGQVPAELNEKDQDLVLKSRNIAHLTEAHEDAERRVEMAVKALANKSDHIESLSEKLQQTTDLFQDANARAKKHHHRVNELAQQVLEQNQALLALRTRLVELGVKPDKVVAAAMKDERKDERSVDAGTQAETTAKTEPRIYKFPSARKAA
jgi:hypothetical protein